ncbi:MAG: SDR family oxidoreductase [Pseudonocardia sp.]|nr:SDR family oxidoreductase [Pseudonocardia sp.]
MSTTGSVQPSADGTPGPLTGRVAVVTGAGHGIGRAYARRLAEDGAAIVVAEIDADAGKQTAEQILESGGKALAVPTDVSDGDSLAAMVDAATAEFGQIDILVNNAAIFASIPISRSQFDQIDPAEWELVLRVNLTGTWLACRAVVPVMRRAGYGKIINISSDTAFKGVRGRAHYVATKAGVVGLTRVLAHELGPDGIRVNCLAPGSTLSEESVDDELLETKRMKARAQALPGVLTPEDMVGTLSFLASPASDSLTGQTLLVNKGAAVH